MKSTVDWHFPLARTHAGIPLGNGTFGALVWGEGRTLRLTLGRADLWDHRGGMPWTEGMSYARIRACLEAGDETGLRALFRTREGEGEPWRPSVIPVGRIDLDLGRGVVLETGTLALEDGTVTLRARKDGRPALIRVRLDMERHVLCITLPAASKQVRVKPIPSWDLLEEALREISFEPPTMQRRGPVRGWAQPLPADPGVGVAVRRQRNDVLVAVARGADAPTAWNAAAAAVNGACKTGRRELESRNARWWRRYWRRVPRIDIPNPRLAFLYEFGMYKFGGFTNSAGTPATLQGPWIEEYRLPPWSSDYHFNINVQMCYQPAYHGNLPERLLPLFEMIFSWEEQLRHNARIFLGIDDGMMLPHAVDDRCTCMGGFWSGTVDHGCTAWVALMMFRYYRYTMDRQFLKRAWPFMTGTMRVYEEMLERDGNALVLPIGVSPEYRGAAMNAWGRNASFQLACIHALAEALIGAAKVLRRKPRPVWTRIRERLPKAAIVEHEGRRMIGLWEGLVLEESHRHHSHLGGITPFDTIDPDDPRWRPVIRESLAHWVYRGPGLWSGWCLSWASALHSRVGNGEAAEFMLEAFDRFYTNEGYGTLHDADAAGFTTFGQPGITERGPARHEVMQTDGGMGSAAAVQEMLLHTRRGVTHLFPGVPRRWREASFNGMRTDGGFLVDAVRRDGQTVKVTVRATADATLRLANPWNGTVRVQIGRQTRALHGRCLRLRLATGQRAVLRSGAG